MKQIPLTQGRFALVDDEYFDIINQWKWHYWTDKKSEYAVRHKKYKGKITRIMMHKAIMGVSKEMVDHRNGNGIDNQKDNLRICSRLQNNMNRAASSNNLIGIKGVSWHKGKWEACIGLNNKKISLGRFYGKENAALVYKLFSRLYFGDFAFVARNIGTSTLQ